MAAVVTPTGPKLESSAGTLSPQAGTSFDATAISEAIARGFDPVLKSIKAIEREVTAVTKSMTMSAELAAQRLEKASRISTSTSGLRSPSGMSPDDAAAAALGARQVVTAGRNIPLAPVAPQAVVNRSSGTGGQAYSEAYANSVQNLRSNVVSRVAEQAQNWAGKDGLMQDPANPNIFYYADPSLEYNDGLKRWTRNGRIVSEAEMVSRRVVKTPGFKQNAAGKWINEATGKFASADEVQRASTGWDTVSRYMAKQRVAGAVASAGQAVMAGESVVPSLMSALPARTAAMIGTGAGLAAAAYTGVRSAAARSQQLYAQGQAYSQFTGGTALEGFGDSLRDRFGAWQQGFNFFGPGSEDYTALANASTQLGMRGSRKDYFVNYGLDLQGDLKMGSQETVQILSAVTQAGDSLMNLDLALRSVTDSAREAGTSTKEAREEFVQNYEAIRSEWMYASGSAKTVATGLTNASTSMGAGSSGFNMDQSARMRAALAGRAGMSISEFSLKARNDPAWSYRLQEDWAKDMLNQGVSGEQEFGAAVEAFMRDNPNFDMSRMSDKSKLINYLYGQGFSELTVQPILAAAGLQAPMTEEAMVMAASLYTGNAPSSQIQKAANEIDSQYSAKPMTEGYSLRSWYSKNKSSLFTTSMFGAYAEATGMKDYDTTRGYYGDGRGLTSLPMVEQYMKDVTDNKIADDGAVIVNDENGKQITVDAATAIRYYSDQLQAGTAIIAAGEANKGKTLAELYGVSGQYTGGQMPSSGTGSTTGGTPAAGAEQTVTLTLTPDAQRVLAIMGAGGTTSSTTIPVYWDGTPMALPGATR